MIKYKGYQGKFAYDHETKRFYGEVADIKDVITFEGASEQEIEIAFRDSVDDYLEWCKKLGQEPLSPRQGWEESFKKMAECGDDALLDAKHLCFDNEDWE